MRHLPAPDRELVPNLRRHVFHLTVPVITTGDRADSLLEVLDALRALESVEGFAIETEDFTGYLVFAKTAGLPSEWWATDIPAAWREE